MEVYKKEIFFGIVFCLFLVSVLTIFFPQPYYFINGGLELKGSYDAEADYFAAIISTYINGHPMDFLHPGIPINYFSAFLIHLFASVNTVEEIILVSRANLLFLNLIFIYIGSRLILKQTLTSSILLLSILLLHPAGFLLVDHLSPNSILFGLAVLLIALGQEIGKKYSITKLFLYSLILGFAISIKYTAFILALPFFLAVLCINKSDENQEVGIMKMFIYLILVTAFSFLLFVWPMPPFLPFVLTQLGPLISVLDFLRAQELYTLLLLFSLVVIVLILVGRAIQRSQFTFVKIYKNLYGILLIGLILFSIYSCFIWDSYAAVGYSLRNHLPLLGIAVLFLPKDSESRYAFFSNPYFIGLIFSILLIVKLSFNITTNQKAIQADQDFTTFLDSTSTGYDYLVFYPIDRMISKDLFLIWSDYRYGDTQRSFLSKENQIPFSVNERIKKMRIFNSRHFDLPNPLDKPSYRYFNFIMKNDFFTESQKNVAFKQINLLHSKDLCLEPFEDYQRVKSAIIIFPSNLTSFVKDNETSQTDLAYEYLDTLRKDFKNKCNLNTEVNKVLYKDQQYYLLAINNS